MTTFKDDIKFFPLHFLNDDHLQWNCKKKHKNILVRHNEALIVPLFIIPYFIKNVMK